VIGTPIDLARVIRITKPHTRVHYDLQEIGTPNLTETLDQFLKQHSLGGGVANPGFRESGSRGAGGR
jgi:hypothetical protein